MYTKATQKFGSWKPDHWLSKRSASTPSFNFIFSLAILAFISWLIFFISLKIRGEFYFFETSTMQLPKILDGTRDDGQYIAYRTPAAAVGIVANRSKQLSLIFDDGSVYRFPGQKVEIENYLTLRFKRLELTAMLTKIPSTTIGRIQIWAEQDIPFQDMHFILDMFTRFGFDEFDFALTVPANLPKGAKHAHGAEAL